MTVGPAAFSESVPKGDVVSTDPYPGARVLDHGTCADPLAGQGAVRRPEGREASTSTRHRTPSLEVAPDLRPRRSCGGRDTVPRGTVITSNPARGTAKRPAPCRPDRQPRPAADPHRRLDRQERRPRRARADGTSSSRSTPATRSSPTPSPDGRVISQSPADRHRCTTATPCSWWSRRAPSWSRSPATCARWASTRRPAARGPGLPGRRSTRREFYLGLGYVASSSPEPGRDGPQGQHRHPPRSSDHVAWPAIACRGARTSRRTTLLATAALLAVTACWGSTFFLIHDLLDRVPTLDFLAVRFAIASLTLSLLAPRALGRLDPRVAPARRRPRLPLRRRPDPADRRPRRRPRPACPASSPACTSSPRRCSRRCSCAPGSAPSPGPRWRLAMAGLGVLTLGGSLGRVRRGADLRGRDDLRAPHRRARRLVARRSRRWACRSSS